MSFKQETIENLEQKKSAALHAIEVNNQTIKTLRAKNDRLAVGLDELDSLLRDLGVEEFAPGKKVWHRDYDNHPGTIVSDYPGNDRVVWVDFGQGQVLLTKSLCRFSE